MSTRPSDLTIGGGESGVDLVFSGNQIPAPPTDAAPAEWTPTASTAAKRAGAHAATPATS